MINCAIFDFDGTIADTEPIWCEVVKSILEEQGCTKEFNYDIWKENYQHKPNVSKMVVEDYDLPMSEQEFKDMRNKKFMSLCKEDYVAQHNILHNARNKAVIQDLKSLNKRTGKCYLVSCSREDAVRDALNTLGIENMFKKCYFSVLDKESIYKEIVEDENLDFNEVVLYEDSKDNVKLGKKLGMLTFHVNN